MHEIDTTAYLFYVCFSDISDSSSVTATCGPVSYTHLTLPTNREV